MTCPTLVLVADCDHWLGVGLTRGIEGVVERPEVHVLRGASHWIQQDKCAVPCTLRQAVRLLEGHKSAARSRFKQQLVSGERGRPDAV